MKNFSQSIGNPIQGGVGFSCTFSLCLRVPFLNCLQHPVGAASQELSRPRGGDSVPFTTGMVMVTGLAGFMVKDGITRGKGHWVGIS